MTVPQSFSSNIVAIYAGLSGVLSVLMSTPFLWFFTELPEWLKVVSILILLLGIWEVFIAYKIWKAAL